MPTGSLRSHAALSTVATAVQGVARLAFSVLVGTVGGRELLGQTNTSLSVAVLTSQLGSTAAAASGTRFVAGPAGVGDPEAAAGVARHIAVRAALLALVVPSSVALGASLFLGFGTGHTIATIVLASVYSVYVVMRGVQYGLLRFRHVAVWDTIAAAVALSSTVAVLALDLPALALLPLTLGYGVFAVRSWPRRAAQRVDPALRHQIDRFIGFGAITLLASGGLLQASQLAARYLTDEARAGDFAAALSLATPASMLAIALNTVLVPPLAAAVARADRPAIRQQADAIMRRLSAIFVGVFGVLVLLAPAGLALLYGPAYVGASDLLPVLLVALMIVSVGLGAATTLQTTRRRGPQLVAACNVGGLVVSLLWWGLLGPQQGTLGVAVGYLVGSGVTAVALVAAVWHLESAHWWGLTARAGLGTALVVALALLTRDIEGLTGTLAQLGAAAVFALSWAALARHDVRALWRTVRGGPDRTGQ